MACKTSHSPKGIQRRLIHDLFGGENQYDERSEELPILHQDQTVNVTLSMQLNQIVDVVSKVKASCYSCTISKCEYEECKNSNSRKKHSNFCPLTLLRFGSVDSLKLPQCSVGNIRRALYKLDSAESVSVICGTNHES